MSDQTSHSFTPDAIPRKTHAGAHAVAVRDTLAGQGFRAEVDSRPEKIGFKIREAALEELQQYGATSAVATYVPMLKSNINSEVNRAARALSFFPNPELALTMVNALVTEHKSSQAVGGGTQASFSPDGNGGAFTSGGKTVVVTQKLTNPAVLTVLKMIEPEVDYGFDELRWRNHFANKRAGFTGDLRRDP